MFSRRFSSAMKRATRSWRKLMTSSEVEGAPGERDRYLARDFEKDQGFVDVSYLAIRLRVWLRSS